MQAFFTNFDRFFNENYVKECKLLIPMLPADQPINILQTFYKLGASKQQASKTINQKYSLFKTLLYFAKRHIIYASIFRIVRQSIAVAIPFIMKEYLNIAKKNHKIEWQYCLTICVIISAATLVRDLFSQSSFRQTSFARKKLLLIMRSMFYDKLLNSNFEFVSQINAGFVNKMLLFDIDPIVEFICCLPALSASPIITIYAFFMIWNQLRFSWYFMLIVVFYLTTLYITAVLMKHSIGLRKQYRATSTAIHGYL